MFLSFSLKVPCYPLHVFLDLRLSELDHSRHIVLVLGSVFLELAAPVQNVVEQVAAVDFCAVRAEHLRRQRREVIDALAKADLAVFTHRGHELLAGVAVTTGLAVPDVFPVRFVRDLDAVIQAPNERAAVIQFPVLRNVRRRAKGLSAATWAAQNLIFFQNHHLLLHHSGAFSALHILPQGFQRVHLPQGCPSKPACNRSC